MAGLFIIIPAAGASTRYAGAGGVRSKLDEDLGGKPVLRRTVEFFSKRPEVDGIIVAGPHDPDAFAAFRERHGDALALLSAKLVPGGVSTRTQSVRAALAAVPKGVDSVAVHDAARPCLSAELFERLLEAHRTHPAVVPGVPVAETLKRVAPEPLAGDDEPDPLDAILGSAGKARIAAHAVEQTLDRAHLMLIQTPQVFSRDLLDRAYANPDAAGTDDAALVERLGHPVVVVPGDPTNIKITTPADLTLARHILGVSAPDQRPAHKRF
jgi:2-C-methyl-D-erythritol 4-phosphate cytidylyltransferase